MKKQWEKRKVDESKRILMESAVEAMEFAMSDIVKQREDGRKTARLMKVSLLNTSSRLKAISVSSLAKRKEVESSTDTKRMRKERMVARSSESEGSKWENEEESITIFTKISTLGIDCCR